ncbi:MAG: hypothetical protein LBL19_04425 [Spirochaetaceae bacterium]|jgi:hypothetical protein|nr:hypothetical protein [Spirochaetaceae bacterium]
MNSDNPAPPGGHDPTLEGKWYFIYDDADVEDELIYEFRSDGTFFSIGMGGYTFSTSGGVIRIFQGGGEEESADYTLSGTVLTISHAPKGNVLMNGTYHRKTP